jgi:hypothetical protein
MLCLSLRRARKNLRTCARGPDPTAAGRRRAHEILMVAHIEIEVGEELLLGQGVGGVDAEVGSRPG